MEEDDERDDSKRKSRNLSEKKRRDQFNLLVNELSSMVSSTSRKMDKSTVLKSTIAFLKNQNEVAVRSRVHEITEVWKPSFLSNEEFTHLILEALDGFIMVFASNGKICYASESITPLLGHLPNELLSQKIYDLVYEEDQSEIYNILLNPTAIVEDENEVSEECTVSFVCHLKRGIFDSKTEISYEYVQFTGYFKSSLDSGGRCSRFSGYSEDADSRLIFVGTGRLMTPQLIREMSIVDSTKSEFTSRHSLEWKFLFLDHRAPPIVGYMPFEVLGTSGYDYYHFDDLDKVVVCHEALMQKGEGTSCYYRFLTKGQQWIWLQTRYYITYHQWNSKPEFVVCTHRVVNHADVVRSIRKKDNSNKENDDTDSQQGNSKEPSSTSAHCSSPWRGKAARSKLSQRGSPSAKSRRMNNHGSDTTSNVSAESQPGHHTMMNMSSSISERSRSRQSSHNTRTSSQTYSQQFQSHQSPQQVNYSQSSFSSSHPHSQHAITTLAPMSSQMVSHYQGEAGTSQMITPYIEPPQYLTTIPPLIASTSYLTNPSSSLSNAEYLHANIVLTPAQNQIQGQLQKKHEELQKVIVLQQEELRRVSEQLYITTFGIPSIVSVPISYSNNPDARYLGNNHHQPTYNQPQICQGPSSSSSSMHHLQMPALIHGQIEHLERLESQEGNCSEVSYMQLQPTPPSHLLPNSQSHQSLQSHNSTNSVHLQGQQSMQGQQGQVQHHQHVNMLSQSEVESMPLQMGQEQAQLLFNSSGHSGRSSSTSRHPH